MTTPAIVQSFVQNSPALPEPSAPPLSLINVQEAALPVFQRSNIALLPEDQAEKTKQFVWGTVIIILGGSAIFMTESLTLGCSLYLIGLVLLFSACKAHPYEDVSWLSQQRSRAREMTFSGLIENYGLKRVAHYNLLPPAERVSKWKEWRAKHQEIKLSQFCLQELCDSGFMTPEKRNEHFLPPAQQPLS
jgi:hypothetical protein